MARLEVTSYTQPTPHLLTILATHLPYSLPLLRRLQYTRFPGGVTEHSRILYVGDADEASTANSRFPFVVAFIDISHAPETEVWFYSSLEAAQQPCPEYVQEAGDQAMAILRAVRGLRDEYEADADRLAARRRLGRPPGVMFGTLSEVVRRLLLSRGCVSTYVTLWDKWIFRLESLPDVAVARVEAALEREGMSWGRIGSEEDAALVLSRTKIPRTAETLLMVPSVAIKLQDGTPVAWAFLGQDGSLSSLHCEELYRGRGFARAVAIKLMQDHLKDYGGDNHCAADVAPDNAQSQGVCRSLGGQIMWTVSWNRIDLDRLPGL